MELRREPWVHNVPVTEAMTVYVIFRGEQPSRNIDDNTEQS